MPIPSAPALPFSSSRHRRAGRRGSSALTPLVTFQLRCQVSNTTRPLVRLQEAAGLQLQGSHQGRGTNVEFCVKPAFTLAKNRPAGGFWAVPRGRDQSLAVSSWLPGCRVMWPVVVRWLKWHSRREGCWASRGLPLPSLPPGGLILLAELGKEKETFSGMRLVNYGGREWRALRRPRPAVSAFATGLGMCQA